MEGIDVIQVLENCEFFKSLPVKYIKNISEICDVATFEKGETIFQQGDYGEHLYIIAEGHVFLERAMDVGRHKGSVVVAALGKGRVTGCWSTLLGESHILMSSASCQKSTKVIGIKGDVIREMMQKNPDFGFQILERLCFLLRDRIQAAFGAMDKI